MLASKHTAPKEGNCSTVTAIVVPTITTTKYIVQEIDLRQMDEQNLKSLQKSDPFMFYSIPGVLKASLNLTDVDYSDIPNLSHADSMHQHSRPSRSKQQHEAEASQHDANKVSRRTRISFECHPSVIMEDFAAELEQEFGERLLDFDLVSMLARCSVGRQ